MLDDGQSEALNRVDTRNTGRRLEHPEALPGSPANRAWIRNHPREYSGYHNGSEPHCVGRTLSILAVWCISALGIGVTSPHSFWEISLPTSICADGAQRSLKIVADHDIQRVFTAFEKVTRACPGR